jgi:peptidoglycan glycosyltransferase
MAPHGNIDLPNAIRVSCNVYYATVAVQMGADALHDAAVNDFRLAHIPAAKDFVEDLPDCGYGQAMILATPLEMAGVAQAVANNGWQMPPTFIKSISPSPSQESPQGKGPKGHMSMSAADAAVLQNAMLSVTQSGTAVGVFNGLPVQVAGKTGSAQNAKGQKTHSWFIGFAPADHPAIAFACIVERGGFGRSAAAPVCREIVRTAL